MQTQFVITIDEQVSKDFALNFFKSVTFIKSIKQKSNIKAIKDIDEINMISEKSLSEEWLSDEDSRWDSLL
jgi:hypothetical protein